MNVLKFTDNQGDFVLRQAQLHPEIYFPLANEGGMISSVTPWLAGDCKTSQNTYLLAPASSETLHESRATRNFWVSIQGHAPWSVTGHSALQHAQFFGRNAEESVLTGGLLWQQLERRHKSVPLTARTLSFVPAGQEKIEIMQVSLTNTGSETLTLTPIAAVPMYGRSADNIRDHRHVTSLLHRVTVREHGIDLHPTLTFDERGHQKNTVTYRIWGGDENGAAPVGCVPLVQDFVGSGSYDWPEALVCPGSVPLSCPGGTAQGKEAVAALYFAPVELTPEQTLHYQIVLAINEDPTPYLSPCAVAAALERTKAFWQAASGINIRTGNADFDAWAHWVGIQPLLRRICGCSFMPHHDYGRGGRGWRDLWQDSLALLLTDPAKTRQDLLCYFAGVRTDGTNATIIGSTPGEFKADRNNIPRVWMDHGFWPWLTVELYLNETGDDDFLLEKQPYFQDTLPHRGDTASLTQPSFQRSGTVLEHLLIQNVTAFFDVGDHGHMRLRGADWNDGLDMAQEKGESVAFTAAYASNFETLARRLERLQAKGRQYVELATPLVSLIKISGSDDLEFMRDVLYAYCNAMNTEQGVSRVRIDELVENLRSKGDYLKEHIRKSEWVGDHEGHHWFNSYYDNSGNAVEGVKSGDIRMMLTGQVFTILSGTANEEQTKEIIRAADKYLCDPNRGGYCLNTDFQEVKLDMGRMFGFAYGTKENGAVFCHMAVMYAYALYSRGFAAEGWKVLELLYKQCMDFGRSKVLPGIPEYFDERGQGMYPYLTGSGSWLQLSLQTQVFGIRGENGNVMLEPKLLPCHFCDGIAEISCVCAGRRLLVRYHNPQDLDWGQYLIGKAVIGQTSYRGYGPALLIPTAELPDKETVTIDVVLIPKA